MAKSTRLTAAFVKSAKPGRYGDGNNLYLKVDTGKRWLFLFRLDGRSREMGLGSAHAVTLAEARDLAAEAKRLVSRGIDPIEERKRASARGKTFGAVADEFIETKGSAWRNPKHRQQWTNTLKAYAESLRDMPVADITTTHVLDVLKPIWSDKPETASRVRGRIENILDAAKAQGLRTGENPAAWRGNLAHLLSRRAKLTRGHQRALPYSEMPDFWNELCGRSGTAAMALRFTILTAARTNEVLGATWSEVNLTDTIWTVPAERMKGGKPHRVPLAAEAVSILEEMQALSGTYVFPASGANQRLSSAAMSAVLKRMKVDATVHGFRSTFRDWAGDTTDHPREVIEAALAHQIGSGVERAYRRGDALEKRSLLLEEWSTYIKTTN